MAILTVAAAILALGQQAQTPAPVQDPAPSTLEDVVVEGRTLRSTVDRFVEEIVAPPVGRAPARWDRTVCVGVANLRREAAQVIVDRVSAIALDAGLEVGEPGCSPNVLVVAGDDGDAMARGLVQATPFAFRPGYAGASGSARALERFQTNGAPVRWWHVAVPVTRDTGVVAVRMPGENAPVVSQDASRLRTNFQNDLRKAIIVVDLTKAEGVNFQQLGDYVGMVAMAQIDPEAETGAYDTILNLFEPSHRVAGLTAWDASYLKSLYDAEMNRRLVGQQSGEISQLMLRDQEAARAAPTEAPADGE
jgi:hypothetical protein